MQFYINKSDYILTERGIDISIPIIAGDGNVNAWYCEPVKIEPVIEGSFIGDVKQGGSVNFKNIILNPHGNGTHTECVGHISKENYTINQSLKEFHFIAEVITVQPEKKFNEDYEEEDLIINEASLLGTGKTKNDATALLIRTKDNNESKMNRHYSGTNPPYYSKQAIDMINKWGIKHLMVDLPSVDREVDNGALAAHKTFWNYPTNPILDKTITELIYIPDHIRDGLYVVSIQIMSIESDASPSKIVIYEINR